MPKPAIVEIINFGDELLVGIRENSHLTYLGAQLARFGVKVTRSRVISDQPDEIKYAFREAWERADLVITTGGLGPTADDLTREMIGEALGVEMLFNPEVEAAIRDRFSLLGRTMSPTHLKQCYSFLGGEILHNERGTAPGLFYEAGGKTLAMLPGPTHELHPMFEKELMPRLQDRGLLGSEEAYLQVRTCGVGESAIEELVQPLIETIPGLTVAFCAHFGMVDVRLSSREGQVTRAELEFAAQAVRKSLGEDFVCFGHCSLAEVIFHELRALDRTLAVAESCTGGLLGDAFTNIPGASKAFKGGVICYTNEVKTSLLEVPECLLDQHGAVSAECAVAMASGVAERLSADYGLSVTGFAGPNGGNAENPVGTIHLGYHSPLGVWCKTVRYTGGRLDVKTRAVNAALDWMRRKLRKYKVEEFLSAAGSD